MDKSSVGRELEPLGRWMIWTSVKHPTIAVAATLEKIHCPSSLKTAELTVWQNSSKSMVRRSTTCVIGLDTPAIFYTRFAALIHAEMSKGIHSKACRHHATDRGRWPSHAGYYRGSVVQISLVVGLANSGLIRHLYKKQSSYLPTPSHLFLMPDALSEPKCQKKSL